MEIIRERYPRLLTEIYYVPQVGQGRRCVGSQPPPMKWKLGTGPCGVGAGSAATHPRIRASFRARGSAPPLRSRLDGMGGSGPALTGAACMGRSQKRSPSRCGAESSRCKSRAFTPPGARVSRVRAETAEPGSCRRRRRPRSRSRRCQEPLPGQRRARWPHPAAAAPSFPAAGGLSDSRCPSSQPRCRREGSHRRFKTQRSGTPTPRRRARFRRPGPRHPPRLQPRGPSRSRPGHCPAGDTGAPRRPPARPTSPGTCRTLRRGTCAHLVPGAHGRSPRLRTPLPPPSPSGPQPRPPPTFGFPAPPELPLRLGNRRQPRPAPPRPPREHPASVCARAGSSAAPAPAGVPRGKGNRRRLAVSARAPARARGADCGVGSAAPPPGRRKYQRAGRARDRQIPPALTCSCCCVQPGRPTRHSALARLMFLQLHGHPAAHFLSAFFKHRPFGEGGRNLRNVNLLPSGSLSPFLLSLSLAH